MSQINFSLPVREAIAKVEEHSTRVIAALPVPIHEVSMLTLMRTTCKVLENHPEFKVDSNGQLIPFADDRTLYAHYEVGYTLLAKRVASQLREERVLSQEDETLFRKSVGLIRWRPPYALHVVQLRAFNSLVKKIGEQRVERLLTRAGQLWKQAGAEYWQALRYMSDLEKKRIGDTFGNPIQHFVVHVNDLPDGPIAVYRSLLATGRDKEASSYNK